VTDLIAQDAGRSSILQTKTPSKTLAGAAIRSARRDTRPLVQYYRRCVQVRASFQWAQNTTNIDWRVGRFRPCVSDVRSTDRRLLATRHVRV